MSLFKAQDLWSVHCGDQIDTSDTNLAGNFHATADGNIFHASSLTVGTLGEFDGQLMIVSNWTGLLKLFSVSRENPNGYLSDDCLLELSMPQPVLQTCIGKYVSGSQITYLALLHPKSIAIYNLHVIPGTTEHGNEAQLQHIQEYKLAASGAFRVLSGAFGLNAYHECFAVQYLDDTLEFLDQSESVRVTLTDVLLPRSMVYVPSCDSFIMHTDDATLVCYRYQNLISKKIASISWTLNLGMTDCSLAVVSLSLSSLVVCAGDTSLCVVHENGFLVVAKRLQYAIQCFHVYNHPLPQDQDHFMILVVSDTQTILLYDKHFSLLWSATLMRIPISIHLYNTPTLPGLICTLSEEGHLELNYLGTSPLLFIPPPTSKTSHAKTIPQLQQKVKELQQQIADVKRSSGNVDMAESNPHTLHCKTLVEHGVIRVELDGLVIPPFVQACLEPVSPYVSLDQSLFLFQSTLDVSKSPLLFQTRYAINAGAVIGENNLEHSGRTDDLCEGQLDSSSIVVDANVHVVVVYKSPTAQQCYRIIETDILLPLSDLVSTTHADLDDAMDYIEFKGDQPFVPLVEYYTDVQTQTSPSEINPSEPSIGFQFLHSSAKVFLSYNGSFVRIYYNQLSHVHLILQDFVGKYSGQLTLHGSGLKAITRAIYKAIQTYEEKVCVLSKVKEDLAVLSAQYRVIERRLLAKIKDATASNLSSIERLLQDTFTRIMTKIVHHQSAHQAVTATAQEIRQLVTMWRRCWKCDPEDVSGLMMTCLENVGQQNWTEVCCKQMEYILRDKLGLSFSRHKSSLVQLLQEVVDHLTNQDLKSGKPVSPILEEESEDKDEMENS